MSLYSGLASMGDNQWRSLSVKKCRHHYFNERAQAALNAANELATQLHEQHAAQMYIRSSKKAFELIASCLTHDFSAADRGFAQSLLAMLMTQYKTQRWSSAKPQLSQLGLF